jgi:gliding motility-associated lipoprotein GldH
MLKKKNILFVLLILVFAGCHKENKKDFDLSLTDNTWKRYNILKFYIPVAKAEKPVDVYLYVRFREDFEYDKLSVNVIMNTPSGEERIKESEINVRSADGSFLIPKGKEYYEGKILIKKELYLNQKGVLKVEIENLTPRLETRGVNGVGIRLVNL